jgi:hypothetical protein
MSAAKTLFKFSARNSRKIRAIWRSTPSSHHSELYPLKRQSAVIVPRDSYFRLLYI